MAIISLETRINAPVEKVFDMARSVQIHAQSAAWTKERVLDAGKHALLERGDQVTFEAFHLGKKRRHQSKITQVDPPNSLTSRQAKGAFKSYTHQRSIHPAPDGGTQMYDIIEYRLGLGPVGQLIDQIFVKKYMREFLTRRNLNFKRIVEEQSPSEPTIDPTRTPTIPPQ